MNRFDSQLNSNKYTNTLVNNHNIHRNQYSFVRIDLSNQIDPCLVEFEHDNEVEQVDFNDILVRY